MPCTHQRSGTVSRSAYSTGQACQPTLGSAEALDAEATRRVAGVEADARAYLLLRPYLRRAVKVEITDPADPAPYWLVSTRHADALVRALTKESGDRQAGPALP